MSVEREVLDRAIDLLMKFGWCQGTYAKDKEGRNIDLSSERAASFCVIGSIRRALEERKEMLPGQRWDTRDLIVREVARQARTWDCSDPMLADWNDAETRTKAEVVNVLTIVRDGWPEETA